MLLLHHAAAHGDDLAGACLLRVVQRTDIAQNAHLRVLAHGAGVDDDDVRLILVLREAVAHLGKVAAYFFAVGLVLLAAVGVHHCEGALSVRSDMFEDLRTDGLLRLDLLCIYNNSFVCHVFLPDKVIQIILPQKLWYFQHHSCIIRWLK